MINYELILTTNCNRKCSFCYIKQTAFSALYKDIDIFYNQIIEKEGHNSNYCISLFGGEPLLNSNCVKYAIEKFKDENCQIILYTNGDLLEQLINYEYKDRIKLSITVYDIFINLDKYKKILDNFDKDQLIFSYTFDETNLNNVYDFIEICTNLNIKYKIAYSHNLISWQNTSDITLFNNLFQTYIYRINHFFINNFSKNHICLDTQLELLFKKILELYYSKNIKEHYCFNTKQTFYNGKFIGHCIRCLYQDIPKNNLNIISCNNCDFKLVCSKSCPAEYENNEIPKKLCTIEKAGLLAIQLLFKDEHYIGVIKDFLK